MLDGEKRELARVPCRLPVVLAWGDTAVDAVTIDCSRNGVGVLCQLEAFGLRGTQNVLHLARALATLLPPRLTCHFHPELLGSLVVRDVRPMRVELRHGVEPSVELGCRLEKSLSDADTAALGIALPGRGETLVDVTRRAVQPPRVRRGGPARLVVPAGPGAAHGGGGTARRAVRLTPLRSSGGLDVLAYTERVDERGIVLRISDRGRLALETWSDDVGPLLLAFCEAYGARFTLDVYDEYRLVWSGPVRIRSAEVLPEAQNALLLGFDFGRALSPADLRALELERV